ncbi:hypothetical protein C6990_05335 [Nitrosopumilus sp. b3]|uniref:hypothetical protein n=1 Tax=Nitrosopumilus sp. b3 TaxID=2109909 RepID=UPI0015F58C57|nr:hypothetical protein [Nitrosopumilus sp. b3]KAF6247104.1 hypothetical protein C6990_05335 [Nitrosopumilus sp. b3]
MIRNSKFIVSPSTALHYQNSHWIPEINLIVYNMQDMVSDNNANDIAYSKVTRVHELSHSEQGKTGAIINRMAWTENAVQDLIHNTDINNAVKSQIAIDKLHLESIALMEAQVTFQIYVQISILSSEKNMGINVDKAIEYLEKNMQSNLNRDKRYEDMFNKLQDIKEWSGSWLFAFQTSNYALNLSYILPEEQMLADNPALSPNNRFDDTYEILKQMHDSKSLKQRTEFAKFLKPKSDATEGQFLSFLNERTGFQFGPMNCPKDRDEFFHAIQNPCNIYKKKSTKDFINRHEQFIINNMGKVFLDFHRMMSANNHVYVAYHNFNNTYYIPNYMFDDPMMGFAWEHMFMMWSLKEAIITKTSREYMLELIEHFLRDSEMGVNFKNHVNRIFDDIDYSKINPVLMEDFVSTSNKMERKLNW